MRRDSAFIFGASIFTTICILTGVYHWSAPLGETSEAAFSSDEPPLAQSPAFGNSGPAQVNIPAWTDTPIKCFDQEVGEFWTNARDCSGADLHNRISKAETFAPVSNLSPLAAPSGNNGAATARTRTPRKPHLRQVAKSVPDGLSVSCKFPVGKALEVERVLSAAENPAESSWREGYCEWIREVRDKNCGVGRDFFYYERLCPYQPRLISLDYEQSGR